MSIPPPTSASQLRVALLDKFIIHHLSTGAMLDDPRGDSFVRELIQEALTDPEIGAAASSHMLSWPDLAFAYKRVVKELYPDIFLCIGYHPIISVSLPFIAPDHFPQFAADLSAGTSLSDQPDKRREAIARNAVVFCRDLWHQAVIEGKARPKEWAFKLAKRASAQSKGCASVLVVGFIAGGILAAGLWLLL